MKKYLLGLGAMLIGAGLMFVFTHTEVEAMRNENKTADCETYDLITLYTDARYSKIGELTCVITGSKDKGMINPEVMSCVK